MLHLNEVVPTGLLAYLKRARKLLEEGKQYENQFNGYSLSSPNGVFLQPGTPEFDQMESLGVQELKNACFVLIASGNGERLGFSGITLSLPVVIIEPDYSYLKYFCQYIKAFEARARLLEPSLPPSFSVPLGIIAPADIYGKIVNLLAENNHFGLNPQQLEIVRQEPMPAVIDSTAKLAIDERGMIFTKPRSGDIHKLL